MTAWRRGGGGILAVLSVVLAVCVAGRAPATPYIEPPTLVEAVRSGDLPAIAERLPQTPLVVRFNNPGQSPGRYGGRLRMLMHRAKDTRQMTVYGYARLVKYDRNLNLVADILERIEVSEGRSFTLHLRAGHKWSDGHPFTGEDFRYWWEDIAGNDQLYPSGPPVFLKNRGVYPDVTIINPLTVRYRWPRPNPRFLATLARANPGYIYAPAHYLKQFHARYQEPEALAALVAESGQRSWSALHTKRGRLYRFDNPDLPTLQPWRAETVPPANRFVFTRNPYYYKVDAHGRQLPYIDRVIFNISGKSLISGKAASGDIDLQGRYLKFDDYTLLKRSEQRHGYETYLWRIAKGAHLALFANFTHNDPRWRQLVRDVRFRRALSLGINRREINRVIYYGLALEGQNTLLPDSPLYRPEYRTRWARYDPEAANRLLDTIGLPRRGLDGLRDYADGAALNIIVETAGRSREETDVLQLIQDSWRQLGLRLVIKPMALETMRRRIFAGETMIAISSGLENGLANAEMAPDALAPVDQMQYQWAPWGQYVQTNGNSGSPPDMATGQRLMELRAAWDEAGDPARRKRIWEEMLELHASELFSIGIIAAVYQPIVVRNGLRNLPREGIWNWEPGAHFGIYGLDVLWWDREAEQEHLSVQGN